MKIDKRVIEITLIIALFSAISCIIGLFSSEAGSFSTFTSINNQIVNLYGKGIYWRDSVSIASQGIASDLMTLVVAIPWLIVSLVLYTKKSFIGKIMLTGLSGYFLYTYMSYTFLWMYNPLFLIYVLLMSLSLFNLFILFTSFDFKNLLTDHFKNFPVKRIAYFEIIIGVMIGLMWLGMIVPNLLNNTTPTELEHYTTLVIQGMDLGLLLPLSIVSGVMLLKKKPIGYLLSFVLVVKSVMMLLSINAMVINEMINSVEVDIVTFAIFGLAALFSIYLLWTSIYKEYKKTNQ